MVVVGYSRASSFTPLSLSGLIGWYDPSDTATITASGGAVSQLADKSGLNHHLTQGTAGAKPTTGTRTINSLNVLDFDGGDHLVYDIASTAQPVTAYFVCQADVTTGTRSVLGWGSGTDLELYFQSATWKVYAGAAFNVAAASTSVAFVAAVWNGASSKGWVNATSATGSAGGGRLNLMYLGGSPAGDWWDGTIGESIWCTGAHSDATVAQVYAYLRAKWGTP